MKKLIKKKNGGISYSGYLPDSPDRFNDYNIIPSDLITMENVPHDILAYPDNGQPKLMKANSGLHKFTGAKSVTEVPIKQMGGVADPRHPSDQLKQDWNSFVGYMKTKGYAGSKDLDNQDTNMGKEYLSRYLKENPKSTLSYDSVGTIQQSLQDYRKDAWQRVQDKKAVSDAKSYDEFMPNLSQVDGWLGSKTSQAMFPSVIYNGKNMGLSDANKFSQEQALAANRHFQYGGSNYGSFYGGYQPDEFDNRDPQEQLKATFTKPQIQTANFNSGPAPIAQPAIPGAPSATNPITNKPFSAPGTDAMVDFAINGLHAISGLLDQREQNNVNRKIDDKMTSDSFSQAIPNNISGNRGDYDINSGVFRPDEMGAKSPEGMYRGKRYQAGGSVYGSGYADGNNKSNFSAQVAPVDYNSYLTTPHDIRPYTPPIGDSADNTEVNDNAKLAYKYYQQQHNLSPEVAAGIVGNLFQESRLKTGAVEQGNTQAGRGIAQWDVKNRWPEFKKWATRNNKDPMALHTQLDYVLIEPGWGEHSLKKTLAARTPEEAAMIFGKTFERPNEKFAQWDKRQGAANTLYKYFEDGGQADPYKTGGEYDLSDVDVHDLISKGYKVEFL
jgi:hypothetical protein